MQIRNSVALVRGANRGIVRAFVEALLEHGVRRVDAGARAVLEGIEAGTDDSFPDPMAQQLSAARRQDHKAVERQLAAS